MWTGGWRQPSGRGSLPGETSLLAVEEKLRSEQSVQSFYRRPAGVWGPAGLAGLSGLLGWADTGLKTVRKLESGLEVEGVGVGCRWRVMF